MFLPDLPIVSDSPLINRSRDCRFTSHLRVPSCRDCTLPLRHQRPIVSTDLPARSAASLEVRYSTLSITIDTRSPQKFGTPNRLNSPNVRYSTFITLYRLKRHLHLKIFLQGLALLQQARWLGS